MMHYWTIIIFSCLLLAVKGDDQSSSNLRGSHGDRDLAPRRGVQGNGLKTYIVVFKETNDVMSTASTATYSVANSVGGQVLFQYDSVLKGAAVTLTANAAEQLKTDAAIDFIVEDKPVSISVNSWGLDRIDQTDLPKNGIYQWENNMVAGSGINVCDIDTGIDEDYMGGNEITIAGGVNYATGTSGKNLWNDCNGHGTHVAGTIGSRSYGVAPGVTLWAVRVLNCNGSGWTSDVIKGINWCVQKAQSVGGKWVANMSLGSGADPAVNKAVADARKAGVVIVVAAGNSNADACNSSPAAEPFAITVGASDDLDQRTWFSNYGTCVDIFAPGLNILSLWLKNSGQATQTSYLSGTSMASPHVAGAAALYFQNLQSADAVEAALLAAAASGRIGDVQGSPNLLVQVPLSGLSFAPTPAPTPAPTRAPTPAPTRKPVAAPTRKPTKPKNK